MPPDPATTRAGGFRKRLLTMPAAFRHHRHDLGHLLYWEQRAVGPAVSRLAAAFASGAVSPALRGAMRRIGRGGTRGIGGVLAQMGFQLVDALLQHGALRA